MKVRTIAGIRLSVLETALGVSSANGRTRVVTGRVLLYGTTGHVRRWPLSEHRQAARERGHLRSHASPRADNPRPTQCYVVAVDTGHMKEPAETGGLSLDLLSDNLIALVEGSSKSIMVDRGGLQSHEWKRIERLEAAWELANRGLGSSSSAADSGLAEAVTEPTRRSPTPLIAKQIDSIQMARASGESVMSIARRFEVSRMTVWGKTR